MTLEEYKEREAALVSQFEKAETIAEKNSEAAILRLFYQTTPEPKPLSNKEPTK